VSSQTATILVTDLVGSTELRARLGDEHAERLRRVHDRLLRTSVETHGGTVIKGLGDGVLASFAEAGGALAAAVGIQLAADAHSQRHPDLALILRVGLSAGDVTVDADDSFGTPVVEAARLCAAADGREILAAEVVRLLVKGRGSWRFISAGQRELKGLPEPVTAVEVLWERPAGATKMPFPKLLESEGEFRFTGRSAELEVLKAAWRQAGGGERRSVLIGGEPGVGKTRLAGEFASSVHDAGSTVLYGRCHEDVGVPYEPFVEALGFCCEHAAPAELPTQLGRYPGELVRLLPDLTDLVPGVEPALRSDPETEQYRLFQAVASWLAATGEAGSLLLVIDDLQWALPATLRLLAHIVRTGDPARLLIVGTFRDTEAGPQLSPLLADLRRTSTERINLDGLSVDDLTEVIAAPALAATLHEETRGNPFFVGEILRHGVESGVALGSRPAPESVRDVIVSRVARLAPTTGEVLAVAAVLGRDVEVGPLAIVSAVDEETVIGSLDEAAAARLVEETGAGAYRFVHALVRSALDGGMSATRKARLHLKAADVLAGDPDRLAHHLLAAAPMGDPIRTGRACLAAGDRALAVLADAEAEAWYSRGLGFIGEDPGGRVDLLTGLGEAQRRTGDPASRQTLLDAARLAVAEHDVPRLVRAVLTNSRGFFSVIGHIDDERLELIHTALEAIGPARTAERALLLALQASELVFAGDPERMLSAADEAAAIAADLDDVNVQSQVAVRRLWSCLVPDRAAAMAAESGDVIRVAEASADPQLRILSRRGSVFHTVGALVEARQQMAETMAIADDTGRPGLRSLTAFFYAAAIDALGEHQDALRLTQAAFELGQQAAWPDAMVFYAGRMVEHWLYEGPLDMAVTIGRQVAAQNPGLWLGQSAAALALAIGGQDDELADFLGKLAAVLPTISVGPYWLAAHFLLAAAQGFGTEDRQSAAALYDLLMPYRALHAAFGASYLGPIEVPLAVGARVKGDIEAALVHHEAAAVTIDACGAARARALNGYQWARTLLARGAPGDRQRAREIAEETLAYCTTKGYATFVTKTEELLAAMA